MAASGATFRRLLPLSRPLLSRLPAAAARPYGVRASDTGELVTHTGQVSAGGACGRRRVARESVLLGEGGRVQAAAPAVPAPAGRCCRGCGRHGRCASICAGEANALP